MSFINKFFGSILSAFNDFTGHYVLALLLFALLVKVILLPFGIKQQKNSVKQAAMKPKEMAIRNKYRGRTDQPTQQKMNNEIMELYQQEGYNPAGGCLPLLIQMVIIIILYGIVYNPLKYICGYDQNVLNVIASYAANLGETIKGFADGVFKGQDIYLVQYVTAEHLGGINEALKAASLDTVLTLESIPNFNLFGQSLATAPTWTTWLVAVPWINCAFTLGSMYLTRKLTFQPMADQNGKSMTVMNLVMAGMTTWLAFTFPAALGIYWIFNTVLGVAQQFILYKVIPLPKFTEADYKQAEREYLGRSMKKEQAERVKAALARPLDEEEYADLGDYHSVYDEKPAAPQAPAASGDSPVGKAPLKKKNK